MSPGIITKYFPDLPAEQKEKLDKLGNLYSSWNEKINLISRKDMGNFYERHVLHSMAIAKVFSFSEGAMIMDAGTGGGFPGIPLAILFPQCNFHLVDSTAKKLKAVIGISEALELVNVTISHQRLEEVVGQYDFVVSRALASLPQTVQWIWKNILPCTADKTKNGLIYLKGGDFREETDQLTYPHKLFLISDFFEEEYFETKKIVYIRKTGTR